jgi:transcriptional regulator with XRE-family HTH domain
MKLAFAKALKQARKSKGLTQEDFSDTSSRTYLSTLERGMKSPTLDKVNGIAQTLGIHVVSLITLTCLYLELEQDWVLKEDFESEQDSISNKDLELFLLKIKREIENLH